MGWLLRVSRTIRMCRGEVFGRTLSFRRPFLLLRVVAAYDLVCSPSLSCRPQATGASSLCPQLPAANLSADRADNGQADDANHRRGGIGAFFLMTTHARLRRWLKNASNSARPTVTARPSGRDTGDSGLLMWLATMPRNLARGCREK